MKRILLVALTLLAGVAIGSTTAEAQCNPVYNTTSALPACLAKQQLPIKVPSGQSIEIQSGATLTCDAGANCPGSGSATAGPVYGRPVYSMLNGDPGTQGGGSAWQTQAHADFNNVQTTIRYNPTYWQVYTNAAQGVAQSQTGTNQLVGQSGSAFDFNWVGKVFFYWNETNYKVASVSDATHLTVQTVGGGSVTFPSTVNGIFYYAVTSTDSVVNTNGTAVTWVSGQPFIALGTSIAIGGSVYPVSSFNSPTSITLASSAGVQTSVVSRQEFNDNNTLSQLRVQSAAGNNEEASAWTITPSEIRLESVVAGIGNYLPIDVYNGGQLALSVSTGAQVTATHDGTANTSLGIANSGGSGVTWYALSKTDGHFALYQNGASSEVFNVNPATNAPNFLNGATVSNSDLTVSRATGNAAIDLTAGIGGRTWYLISTNGGNFQLFDGSNVQLNVSTAGATFGATVATGLYTVSSGTGHPALPSASSAGAGARAYVTDAVTCTFLGSLTGGGSTGCPVVSNGTTWQAGG